jgi:hypothetical protein
MIRQTALPFKLERTDETLTAHGDLALPAEDVVATSLCQADSNMNMSGCEGIGLGRGGGLRSIPRYLLSLATTRRYV